MTDPDRDLAIARETDFALRAIIAAVDLPDADNPAQTAEPPRRSRARTRLIAKAWYEEGNLDGKNAERARAVEIIKALLDRGPHIIPTPPTREAVAAARRYVEEKP